MKSPPRHFTYPKLLAHAGSNELGESVLTPGSSWFSQFLTKGGSRRLSQALG